MSNEDFEFGQEDQGKLDETRQKRLDRITEDAEKKDVTYDLNQWFRHRMIQKDPELLKIQRRGFASEAVAWLRSTTPKGMECGRASKEERFERAREFADKAQTTIEELAEQKEIELLE